MAQSQTLDTIIDISDEYFEDSIYNSFDDLIFNGNDLYFIETNVATWISKIHKTDITNNEPTVTEIYISPNPIFSLALYENYLFFSYKNNLNGEYVIAKIDITSNNPVAIDVINLLNSSTDLVFKENELYFTNRNDPNTDEDNSILKINVIEEDSEITTLISGLIAVRGLTFYGNDLFFIESQGSISKIDINDDTSTKINYSSGLGGVRDIEIHENLLYIIHRFESWSSINLRKKDVSVPPLQSPSEIVFTNLEIFGRLRFNENLLYVSGRDKILRIDFSTLSNYENYPKETDIKIYPNPTTDFIKISGLKYNEDFLIYDFKGAELFNGKISNNENINIRNLSKGLYFLKLANGNIIKFIKK